MLAAVDTPAFWEEKYINNESNWDLKAHNPVFEELIKSERFIKPGSMLIAGCGKGYDAVFAARAGYTVTAVDFSSTAIECARELAARREADISLVKQDIFSLGENFIGSYDTVYDYVTYCAIHPSRRKEYSRKLASFLKPGGRLVAILFPVEDRPGGPPFAVNPITFYEDISEYLQLEFSSKKINSVKPRKGREILQIYIKAKKSDREI